MAVDFGIVSYGIWLTRNVGEGVDQLMGVWSKK